MPARDKAFLFTQEIYCKLFKFLSLVFFELFIFMVNDSLFLIIVVCMTRNENIFAHNFIETCLCCLWFLLVFVIVWSVEPRAERISETSSEGCWFKSHIQQVKV